MLDTLVDICTSVQEQEQGEAGNHARNMPFPSLMYSALPLKLEEFSDNYHPFLDNGLAFSVIPKLELPNCVHQYQQPLHSADALHHHSGDWWGNVHGNSGPWSAPATYATTKRTAFSYTSTISPFPPAQSAQPIGTIALADASALTTTRKVRRVPCDCPNCVNGLNSVKNQDGTVKKSNMSVIFWDVTRSTSRRLTYGLT